MRGRRDQREHGQPRASSATHQSSAVAKAIRYSAAAGGFAGLPPDPSLEPHAAAAGLARRALPDQLDAGAVERADELHQRIDIAADDALARLHALDRRHRQAALRGELALVDAEEGAGGAQLCSGDHTGRNARDPRML